MEKYRSLNAWKRAHELLLVALRATDAAYHARARALFDQIRRAAISVEANIVEGYALGTAPLFRRHARIAAGSAAEAECLIRAAGELSSPTCDPHLPLNRAVQPTADSPHRSLLFVSGGLLLFSGALISERRLSRGH